MNSFSRDTKYTDISSCTGFKSCAIEAMMFSHLHIRKFHGGFIIYLHFIIYDSQERHQYVRISPVLERVTQLMELPTQR